MVDILTRAEIEAGELDDDSALSLTVRTLHQARQLEHGLLNLRRELALRARDRGLSFREIGERIGVDKARVFRIITGGDR